MEDIRENLEQEEKETPVMDEIYDPEAGPVDEFDEEEEKEPELTEIEKFAYEKGWRPNPGNLKEDRDAVDAKTFLDNQWKIDESLKKTNKRLLSRVDDLDRSVKQFIAGQNETKREKIELTHEELKKEKRDAIERGDVTEVERLEEEIEKVKASKQKVEQPVDTKVSRTYTEWIQENPWYGKGGELDERAYKIAEKYQKQGYSEAEYLEKVTEEIRPMLEKDSPARKEKKKNVVQDLNTGQNSMSSASKVKVPFDRAPDSAKKAAETFSRTFPELYPTKQAYIDHLVKEGILK